MKQNNKRKKIRVHVSEASYVVWTPKGVDVGVVSSQGLPSPFTSWPEKGSLEFRKQ